MHYCTVSCLFVVSQNVVMNSYVAIQFLCNFCIGKHCYGIQCKNITMRNLAARYDSIATKCINNCFTAMESNIVQSEVQSIILHCIALQCNASALTFLTPPHASVVSMKCNNQNEHKCGT